MEQKKAEKVPLRKGWVPKIIVGAQRHPETEIDAPLGGLVSLWVGSPDSVPG